MLIPEDLKKAKFQKNDELNRRDMDKVDKHL
jgi:hypothetical protein